MSTKAPAGDQPDTVEKQQESTGPGSDESRVARFVFTREYVPSKSLDPIASKPTRSKVTCSGCGARVLADRLAFHQLERCPVVSAPGIAKISARQARHDALVQATREKREREKVLKASRTAVREGKGRQPLSPGERRCSICGFASRELELHLLEHERRRPIGPKLLNAPTAHIRDRHARLTKSLGQARSGVEASVIRLELERLETAMRLRRVRVTMVQGGSPGTGKKR